MRDRARLGLDPTRAGALTFEAYGPTISAALEVELVGTPFQRAVWSTLRGVRAGATTTYGALTGYAGGLRRKAWLLEHERGSGPALNGTPWTRSR